MDLAKESSQPVKISQQVNSKPFFVCYFRKANRSVFAEIRREFALVYFLFLFQEILVSLLVMELHFRIQKFKFSE